MKNWRNVGIVFLAIFFCISLHPSNIHAQKTPTNVTVVNPLTSPVPVSGNVGITGGNIAITGTPNVNVTNTVGVSGTIGINPMANTVRIEGGTPFIISQDLSLPMQNMGGNTPQIPIPDATQLEIYSIYCTVPSGQPVQPYIDIFPYNSAPDNGIRLWRSQRKPCLACLSS